MKTFLSIISVVFLFVNAIGQESITIPYHQDSVEFDGKPFEKIWKEMDPFTMITLNPVPGQIPSEHTEVRIFYDNEFLWVGCRMFDSEPSKIKSASKKRDENNGNSDWICIVIDGFNDNENAVGFLTNPIGLRSDLAISNDAKGDNSLNFNWNTFWDVKTSIDEKGWYAEFRIPISSLRFQERSDRTIMGLIIWRWIPRKNELATFPILSPEYGESIWKPSLAVDIEFEKIKSKNPVFITPYLIAGWQQSNDLNDLETAYKENTDPTLNVGLDLKYAITNNLTLDVTANTDFAQVEADDQQINLTRFSLFYPEKRQFFQERSSNFDFKMGEINNMFYSRQIGISEESSVPIYGGMRVVGRMGKWDIGVLDMQTAQLDTLTSENMGVFRLRRQIFNPFSYVGGILTSRLGADGTYNQLYGLDGIFRMFEDDYLDVKWTQSIENGKKNNLSSLSPSSFYVNWLRRNDKGFSYNFSHTYSGKDFNPGLGFQMLDSYNQSNFNLQYGWLSGENSKLFSHKFFVAGSYISRLPSNSFQSFGIGPHWMYQTKKMWLGLIAINYMDENVTEEFSFNDDVVVPVGRYQFFVLNTFVNTSFTSPFYSLFELDAGQFYDGYKISAAISPSWSINSSLNLSAKYGYDRVIFNKRNQELIAHIGQLRLLYMFSTKLSISTFIQFNSTIDGVITNFRLRYNPKEGNDLYFVYNEELNTHLTQDIPNLPRSSSRTFLLKYTYTFSL